MEFALPPTMFDYCLAMAMLYFKEQQCDFMVIETGIGGRYDSTNALGTPEVAIITKIGFDHMGILGDTLAEIAGEKAGIMKTGAPLVTQRQEPEVQEVLEKHYLEMMGDKKHYICVTEADIERVKKYPMKMLGKFQMENAATAMKAADILMNKWYGMTMEHEREQYIRKGIQNTFWKGRMELVRENPFFMIDGAHNAHGVHALAESLKDLYPGERFHFIMGVMADKDYEDMIRELLPLARDFVTVTPECSRALQSRELAECIEKAGIQATYQEDMELLIRPYLSERYEGELVNDGTKTIAFGSLYFIGAIERMIEKYS